MSDVTFYVSIRKTTEILFCSPMGLTLGKFTFCPPPPIFAPAVRDMADRLGYGIAALINAENGGVPDKVDYAEGIVLMRDSGGHFCEALGAAATYADRDNWRRLWLSFSDLFMCYQDMAEKEASKAD